MEQSPETRIALLESNHNQLMDKIEEIFARFDKFEEKLDKALEKKADVWVEKAISYVLYTVAGIVIGAMMYLIIKYKL